MANFDEDHKLIWTEITPQEAQLFINFLRLEVDRHEREEEFSQLMASIMDSFSKEVWESAYLRHTKDVREINELISKVKEYFRL